MTSLAPWLPVRDGAAAIEFYQSAFGAAVLYRMDVPDGSLVAQLAIDGAAFWLSGAAPDAADDEPTSAPGTATRMILTVADPDSLFARALSAGASQVYPVAEEHGWRLGRLADPFGHHWEIGHPLG